MHLSVTTMLRNSLWCILLVASLLYRSDAYPTPSSFSSHPAKTYCTCQRSSAAAIVLAMSTNLDSPDKEMSAPPTDGDSLEVPIPVVPSTVVVPTLKVLFQNDNIAVVVKPPGIPCHPWEFRRPKKSGGRHQRVHRRRGPPSRDDDADRSLIYTVVDMARETFFPQKDSNDSTEVKSVFSSSSPRPAQTTPTAAEVDNGKKKYSPDDDKKIHLVHRLDAPTSGCLMLAFNADAARQASNMLQGDNGHKTYFALCRGDGVALRRRHGHSRGDGGYFVLNGDVKDSKGIERKATTKIRCWMGSDGQGWDGGRRCCLVEAIPVTGRFHQIRSHLGREHHPLVGETQHHKDIKENRAWKDILDRHGIVQRPCLHCHRLVVEDTDGTGIFGSAGGGGGGINSDGNDDNKYTLDVSCPLPDDLQAMIRLTDWADQAHKQLPQLFVPLR